jgi:dolichol kinase
MAVVLVLLSIAAISKGALVLFIITCMFLYIFHESYAEKGKPLPYVSNAIRSMKRLGEERISFSPFVLGMGIILTVLIFPFKPATAGLLQLAFGDTAAALVGLRYGKKKLPHSPRKSVEGFLAFFVVAFLLMLYFYSIPVSLLLALVGALIESLPAKDWDNFLIPLGVAATASFF